MQGCKVQETNPASKGHVEKIDRNHTKDGKNSGHASKILQRLSYSTTNQRVYLAG